MTGGGAVPGRVGVFGAGAIGSVVGGYLSRAGVDVVLVDPWFAHLERIRRDGLAITAIGESAVASPRVAHLDELATVGTLDIVVIATKAYDTSWMARLIEPHLRPDGVVLSAQNGMNEPILCDVLGTDRVVGCVVPMAAELVGPGQVKRTSGTEWGTLLLGELGGGRSTRVARLAAALEPLGGVETTADIQCALWGKLALNVMSNAVAGLTGFTTGRLWSDDSALDVSVALAHEQALLADRRGMRLDPVLQTIDHNLLREAGTLGNPAWREVKRKMHAVAATRTGAKENVPSLLQDIQKGRRTEIDYLNGWIASQAAELGLPAPVNAAIVAAVHDLELGDLRSGPDTVRPLKELVARRYAD